MLSGGWNSFFISTYSFEWYSKYHEINRYQREKALRNKHIQRKFIY